jgi:hypothetical protein
MAETPEALNCYGVAMGDSHLADPVKCCDTCAQERSIVSCVDIIWNLHNCLGT